MAIEFTTTKDAGKYPKVIVYGPSGVGKTRLCRTAPKPIIISSENKLTSLRDDDIPVIKVSTINDLEDAIVEVSKKKMLKKYLCPCVDSITDIADKAISLEKPNHNDPRKAYGVVQDKLLDLLRELINKDDRLWYFIAKARMLQNEDNVEIWGPRMPGRQMGPELPYIFDFVLPMRVAEDEDGGGYTYLQTTSLDDFRWDAKESSGNLLPREKPDLTYLFKKIQKGNKNGKG